MDEPESDSTVTHTRIHTHKWMDDRIDGVRIVHIHRRSGTITKTCSHITLTSNKNETDKNELIINELRESASAVSSNIKCEIILL